MSEGGFRTFPYAVGRYVTGPEEIWGRSPAMTMLPDIKMVREMSKTLLKAGQEALDPPLLRSQEKARLLAPPMGRQQSESLGPMVERELDLLDQMGWLPPLPDALKAAGGLLDVDYTSRSTRRPWLRGGPVWS